MVSISIPKQLVTDKETVVGWTKTDLTAMGPASGQVVMVQVEGAAVDMRIDEVIIQCGPGDR